MLRLRLNLALSCGGVQLVDIRSLFREDDEANQSRFVETLRSQHLEEILLFGVEVDDTLRSSAKVEQAGSDFIDAALARASLHEIDPSMPESIVSEIIAAGCNLASGKDLDEMLQITMTTSSSVNNNNNTNNTHHGREKKHQSKPQTVIITSSLRYPVEPFLDRIRRNVLVKRYGKCQHSDDSYLGGILASDTSRTDFHNNNNHSNAKLKKATLATTNGGDLDAVDDDEDFFKFMKHIHESDDDEEEEQEEQQEEIDENTQQQQQGDDDDKRKTEEQPFVENNAFSSLTKSSNSNNSIRRKSVTTDPVSSFVRTNVTKVSSSRRKSLYAESQIDKLLQEESENEDDEIDEAKNIQKASSFARVRVRRNSSFRELYQRKTDRGEIDQPQQVPSVFSSSVNINNNNNTNTGISSMANVVTQVVAAENFRRMFQQQQSVREAERRRKIEDETKETRKKLVSVVAP